MAEEKAKEDVSYTEIEKKEPSKKIAVIKKKKTASVLKVKKPDELPLPDGIYVYYPETKRYIATTQRFSAYGDIEYSFVGTLTKGEIKIIQVEEGKRFYLPLKGDWNYGYTLEGDAKALFQISDSLLDYNPREDRSFAYITPASKLYFVGIEGRFFLSLRLFGEEGKTGKRWVVIYLSKQN